MCNVDATRHSRSWYTQHTASIAPSWMAPRHPGELGPVIPHHGQDRAGLDGHLEHGAQILVEEMEQLGSYDQVAGTGNGQEFS